MKFSYCTAFVLLLLTSFAVPAPPSRDHFKKITDNENDGNDYELIKDSEPNDKFKFDPPLFAQGRPWMRSNPTTVTEETEFSESYIILLGDFEQNCSDTCLYEGMECSFEEYSRLSQLNVEKVLREATSRQNISICKNSTNPNFSNYQKSGNQPYLFTYNNCIYGYVKNDTMDAASCAKISTYLGEKHFCPCKKQPLTTTTSQTVEVPKVSSFPTSPSTILKNSDCYNSSQQCIARGYGLSCYDKLPFKNTTIDGKGCMNWLDSQKYVYDLTLEPPESWNHSVCRNLDNYVLGPWCFTLSNESRIRYWACWTRCSGPSTNEGKISVTPETAMSTDCYNKSLSCIASGYGQPCYTEFPLPSKPSTKMFCQNLPTEKPFKVWNNANASILWDNNKCSSRNFDPAVWCYAENPKFRFLGCWFTCSSHWMRIGMTSKATLKSISEASTESSSEAVSIASSATKANASEAPSTASSTTSLETTTTTASEASSTTSSSASLETTTITISEKPSMPLATTKPTVSEASSGSTESVVQIETGTTTNSTAEDARQERIKKYVAAKMMPVIIAIAIMVVMELILLVLVFREWKIRNALIKEEESAKINKKNIRHRENSKVRRSSAKAPKKSSVDKPQGRRPSSSGKNVRKSKG